MKLDLSNLKTVQLTKSSVKSKKDDGETKKRGRPPNPDKQKVTKSPIDKIEPDHRALVVSKTKLHNHAGIVYSNGRLQSGELAFRYDGSKEDLIYTVKYYLGQVPNKINGKMIDDNPIALAERGIMRSKYQGPDELFSTFVLYNQARTKLFQSMEKEVETTFTKKLKKYNEENNTNIRLNFKTGELINE